MATRVNHLVEVELRTIQALLLIAGLILHQFDTIDSCSAAAGVIDLRLPLDSRNLPVN